MTLAELWFLLIAVLWVGYFFLEGFDFGVGISLLILGRDDMDRRLLLNSIGPTWDGNEVWLLVAGGATFAAFPEWYATLFSGFYLPLFLIVVSLIIRVVGFEYRQKGESLQWRRNWDIAIFVSSLLPAILWGVAFANIIHGVKIDAHHEYAGGFFDLLNPYALLGGVTTLLLFLVHGNVFLTLKNTGDLQIRARRLAKMVSIPACLALTIFAVWTYIDVKSSLVVVIPAIGVVLTSAAAIWLIHKDSDTQAFVCTGLTTVLLTALLFLSLYPNVMPSSISGTNNLTIANASSTSYTLTVMTVVAGLFVPVVLAYQIWTYWIFRKRLVRPESDLHVKPII